MAKTSNYVPQDSPLDRMDPRAKIYAIFCLGIAAIIFPYYQFSYLIVIGLFIAAGIAKLLKKFTKFMLAFAIPILIMLIFIQGFYSPKNVTIIADCGFAKLGLEGVEYALKIVGSLLVFLGSFYLMTTTTYTGRLVAALVDSGMNMKVGYLVLACLNVVPQMQRRMLIIQEAQAARGVDTQGTFFSRLKAYIPLLGPVVMSSFTDAQERGMTLETRGFGVKNVKPTTFVEAKKRTSDRVVQILLVVFLVATIAATVFLKLA